MSSRKHPSLLSERQIRRKVAQEVSLVHKEIENKLLQNTRIDEPTERKIDDSSKSIMDRSTNVVDRKFESRCLLNYLCNSDVELDEKSEKILKDFERQLNEKCFPNSDETMGNMIDGQCNDIDIDSEISDTHLDFFDIILKIFNDIDEDDISESEEDSNYLDAIMSLDKDDPTLIFVKQVRALCVKYIHTVPHVFVNELLDKLRQQGYPLPKDARTFLKTPRTSVTHAMASGNYCHYGIESALITFLITYKKENIEVDCIPLIANIDGAKLHNSSEQGSWIISISETILNLVEVTGIYDGEQKPKNSDDLVSMFVKELTHFINNGIVFEGKKFNVQFNCLICDAPAKAYILKTKLFSGYYSCSKCTIEGDYDRKVFFPTRMQKEAVLRTDEAFHNQEYEQKKAVFDDFQMGETVMKEIPKFRPITDVVLDYMHLICLGIMVKLIELWIQNPKVVLSEVDRVKVSEALLSFKKYMPSDFSRTPRQFKNVKRLWKAHELRSFLLYTGPLALFGILPKDCYDNFLYLHVAISILVNPILCESKEYVDYAEVLLIKFVETYEKLYGESNMVFNVHNILHLVNDVRNFGCLDNFSAFRFENHIGRVKQFLRKGDKRLQQIGNRLMEIRASKEYDPGCDTKNTDFLQKNKNEKFQVVQTNSHKLDCRNEKDKYVLLDDGSYLECQYFVKGNDGQVCVVGRLLETLRPFYELPMSSDYLNINIISSKNCKNSAATFSYECIIAKVCKFPIQNVNEFVAVPLIHTYKRI